MTLLLPSVLNVGFSWKIRDIMEQSVYARMSIYLIVMDFLDNIVIIEVDRIHIMRTSSLYGARQM